MKVTSHLVLGLLIVTVFAAACGGGTGGAPEEPTPIQGSAHRLEPSDPAALCFDDAALPSAFVNDGEGVLDPEQAALITYADPARRKQEYQQWGRLTGYHRQWAYGSPLSLQKGQTPDDDHALEEQAQGEVRAAPFAAAICIVDLYQDEQGAHEGFAALAADPTSPMFSADEYRQEADDPGIGDEGRALTVTSQWVASYEVDLRYRNAVGVVRVIAPAGKDLEPHALRLAQALLDQLRSLE